MTNQLDIDNELLYYVNEEYGKREYFTVQTLPQNSCSCLYQVEGMMG